MNKHPKTVKQLDRRLTKATIDHFPFGKHKGKLVALVVKEDPNYVIWWNEAIVRFPIEPSVVLEARKNYRHRARGGYWEFPEAYWDIDEYDIEPEHW